MELRADRYDTLLFMAQEFVKVKSYADWRGYRYEPREYQVNGTYLEKAGLIKIDETRTQIIITAAGRRVLATQKVPA